MSEVSAIPEGFHSVGCYLIVPNAIEALAFYRKAFGAEQVMHMPGFTGENSTMHAEMKIGDTIVMLSDENPQWGMQSAKALGGSPVSMHMYVEDVDAVYKQAVDAGCETVSPPADMFWGDRMTKVTDPFGISWGIATHTEDVSPEEMAKRQQEFVQSMAQGGGECS